MSVDKRDQIVELLAQGASERAIAKKLGVSRSAVRYWKSANNQSVAATCSASALAGQINKLKTEKMHLSRQVGNWELFTEKMAELAPKLPVPKNASIRVSRVPLEQEMVALLGDAHAMEQWTLQQTDNMSEYNFELFCNLMWYYAQEIIRFAEEDRSKYGLRKLHVDMLGDIFHGVLRVEDEVTNDYPTAPGIALTAWVLYQWVRVLSEHFESINIVGVAGNHGRNHAKPQNKLYVEENKDTLIYLMLNNLIKAGGLGDRVSVNVPAGRSLTFDRMGHRIKIFHGDHISGGSGISGLPVYGITRDMLRQFRKEIARDGGPREISLIECGHFHTHNFIDNVYLVNGALAPADVYATEELGAAGGMEQVIYYTSRKFCVGWRIPLSLKHGLYGGNKFEYSDGLFWKR